MFRVAAGQTLLQQHHSVSPLGVASPAGLRLDAAERPSSRAVPGVLRLGPGHPGVGHPRAQGFSRSCGAALASRPAIDATPNWNAL